MGRLEKFWYHLTAGEGTVLYVTLFNINVYQFLSFTTRAFQKFPTLSCMFL